MKDKNIKELKEQYNKYLYPKPCEDIEKEYIEKKRFLLPDPNCSWHKLWPEKPYSPKKLSILVAGCGTNQAAVLAKCNPNHKFIGVDISENSLAHQKKLIKKHAIKNLKLYCKDFRLLKFKKKFDYIICTGVIHHLKDPGSALKYCNQNLKSDGVLYLMVYGNQNSYPLNQVKKLFSKLNLDQSKKSINIAKHIIDRLGDKHPAKIFAQSFTDGDHDAGVIDFFLHKKEAFFSIKKLISLLAANNLIIKNFIDGRIRPFTKYMVGNSTIAQTFYNLRAEDQWEMAQILNWNDQKIEIACCKKKNYKTSLAYNAVNLNDIYTCKFQNTDYEIRGQDIFIKDKWNNTSFQFQFPSTFKIDWLKILEGKEKLADILKTFDAPVNLKRTISFMIENALLDISFNPIADYQTYYNKKTL